MKACVVIPVFNHASTLIGVALSALTSNRSPRAAGWLASSVAGGAALATILHVPYRADVAATVDAEPYLAELDMATLPADAVVCSGWGEATPLWYARWVRHKRSDVRLICAGAESWLRMTQELLDRPIFTTTKPPPWEGSKARRYSM